MGSTGITSNNTTSTAVQITASSKAKTYYGTTFDANGNSRTIFTTVTGQMADGTLVYTEIKQTDDGAVVMEKGQPKLILDNQYTRHLKHGMQTFEKL